MTIMPPATTDSSVVRGGATAPAPRPRRSGGQVADLAEVEVERGEVLADVLERPRAGDGEDGGRALQQPGELHGVLRHAEALGGAGHAGPAGAAQREVRDECDALALADVDDVVVLAPVEVVVVLHGGDGDDAPRALELAGVDVRDADGADGAAVDLLGERAEA